MVILCESYMLAEIVKSKNSFSKGSEPKYGYSSNVTLRSLEYDLGMEKQPIHDRVDLADR